MEGMGFKYEPSKAGSRVRFDPPNKNDPVSSLLSSNPLRSRSLILFFSRWRSINVSIAPLTLTEQSYLHIEYSSPRKRYPPYQAKGVQQNSSKYVRLDKGRFYESLRSWEIGPKHPFYPF